MYQVVDSNDNVLEKDFPTKKLAKAFRDKHPGTMTQRTANHPKGASHLPQPPKPKFSAKPQHHVDIDAEPLPPMTEAEIEAEADKIDMARTANGGIPIWKQSRSIPSRAPERAPAPPMLEIDKAPSFM